MNIEIIKRLENLKSEQAQLSEVFIDQMIEKKRFLLENIKDGFEVYFTNKGFVINHYSNNVSANYGNLKIDMTIPTPKEVFIGAFSVIKMIITGNQKKTFKIILNEKGSRPSISITENTLPNNEDARFEFEIKNIEEQIIKLKKRTAEINNINIKLRIYDDEEAKKNPILKTLDSQEFDDIKELLDSIFN